MCVVKISGMNRHRKQHLEGVTFCKKVLVWHFIHYFFSTFSSLNNISSWLAYSLVDIAVLYGNDYDK